MYQCQACEAIFEEPVEIDIGIGSYEFWGEKCRDVQMVWACPECDSTDYKEYWEDEDEDKMP